MLSSKKIAAHLREWLKDGLAIPMDRGMSLKDDADGVALHIESVVEMGDGALLVGLAASTEGSIPRREKLVVQVLTKISKDLKQGWDVLGEVSLADDLQVIDDETS